MLNLFISFIMMFLSFFMYFISHPLAMGLSILCQTILLSLLMGMYIHTYWFSYILFLIFLGGLLVLFIYVSNVASNEMIKFSTKLKLNLLISIILSIIFLINYKNMFINFIKNNEMNNFYENFLFFNEYKINLYKLYNKQTFLLTMMLIIYLFITLIAVIKITNIFFGPLRSFN
uniref:NADH-ubiquinone oxidoreductase chain 6 n=2 Tax=Delias pasithoe TaxID=152616 RepID=A0A6H1XJJ1_9NEOP|nr:NADH dehydrogenase subunit 6 [Delias pasithoe]AIW06313.1 NADH dehydrogenase subunit 6 [Delias pasithoe parthenope]QJA15807.1 NADH dehydrogenase subunit 6 [Delias pasithoe]